MKGQLISTQLTEPLWSTLQICMWTSFYLAFPLAIYQILSFFFTILLSFWKKEIGRNFSPFLSFMEHFFICVSLLFGTKSLAPSLKLSSVLFSSLVWRRNAQCNLVRFQRVNPPPNLTRTCITSNWYVWSFKTAPISSLFFYIAFYIAPSIIKNTGNESGRQKESGKRL